MTDFPFKALVLLVALESYLFGFEARLYLIVLHSSFEAKELKGFLFDFLSLSITVLTILFMEKFRAQGRKKFLLNNSLILVISIQASCFFISSAFLYVNETLFIIVQVFLTVIQAVSKTNILTTILSIISIEKYELGFFFAFQFIVFQVFTFSGAITYLVFDSNYSLTLFYYAIIIVFVLVSYYVCNRLSDDHDEVDDHSMMLWINIIKIRFFRMNFTSFALTLGVASYVYTILFKAYSMLPLSIEIMITFLMFSTYPICLYLVYKYQRPVQYKAFTVFGLVFQSMAMMFLVLIYADSGNNTKLLALVSPVLSQVGLVFVTISSLPDMLESTTNGLPHIPFGIVSDRVCSIVFAAYYIGKLFIEISAYVLRHLMPFSYGMIISSLCILVYAGVYEYFGKGIKELKNGKLMSRDPSFGKEIELT